MPRSPALTVEDIPQLVEAIVDGVVQALDRRGIVPGGKSSFGMERSRCDSQENEFMVRTDTATAGDSSSLEQEAARMLSRFRRKQKRGSTRPPFSSRSKV